MNLSIAHSSHHILRTLTLTMFRLSPNSLIRSFNVHILSLISSHPHSPHLPRGVPPSAGWGALTLTHTLGGTDGAHTGEVGVGRGGEEREYDMM